MFSTAHSMLASKQQLDAAKSFTKKASRPCNCTTMLLVPRVKITNSLRRLAQYVQLRRLLLPVFVRIVFKTPMLGTIF